MYVLLIEPAYRNKYPPIGLMKIAYFHQHIRNDHVFFAKGRLPEGFAQRKWDRIYVTSLFTFEYKATIEAIEYAKSLASPDTYIEVGGISASLMPDEFERDTGIRPNVGLLNYPGCLGLPGDECIDELPLDYSILDQIDYKYPAHDAYFLSATKGCGMRCGFCAVQRLEPHYIPYYDIKEKVRCIDEHFGPKKDLLLMDNNVLISRSFNQIIDDILELGFERGATYTNPRTGKVVHRYVDFNQGLDAKLITEEKAKRLGEIALSPARIAFDHIEDERDYIRAIELCAKHGVTEMSNYLLYNSEDFSGKGNQYHADTPENLYARLRISLDLQTRLNEMRGSHQERVSIFSFPMRYIPLDATERGYIGTHWNAKFLRAVQCMLIPTQGKGVGSISFFEADFGTSQGNFVENLCMPESLMRLRGHFVEKKDEPPEDRNVRWHIWSEKKSEVEEWRKLFRQLDDRDAFIKVIADNEFLPEKLLRLTNPLWQKLYLHYLTIARVFKLMDMLKPDSPTFKTLHEYIVHEAPVLYRKLRKNMIENQAQQVGQIKAYSGFFGRNGIIDLLKELGKEGFQQDAILKTWARAYQKNKDGLFDYSLLQLYRRYVDLDCLEERDIALAENAIVTLNSEALREILYRRFGVFKEKVAGSRDAEVGESFIKIAEEKLFQAVQLSFFSFVEG